MVLCFLQIESFFVCNDICWILLIVCRPLFASSLLGIVRTLLDETRQDEMQILACNILVDFINSQVCNGKAVDISCVRWHILYGVIN